MQAQAAPCSDKNPTSSIGRRRLAAYSRKLAFAIAAVAAATLTSVPSAATQANEPTIEGVWRVTRHGVNCQTGQQLSSFPAIMAFNKDGIVTAYGVPPGSTPALQSPEYGVWKRGQGPGAYSFRLLSYSYAAGGTFSGGTDVTGDLVMEDPNNFTYQASVQFFDLNGNPTFAVCGASAGTRIQ